MNVKLTRDVLVGDRVRTKGDIIQAEGRYAEQLVKSGAGIPFAGSIEAAALELRTEKATGRGQR